MITTVSEMFDRIEEHFSKEGAKLSFERTDDYGVNCVYRKHKDRFSPVRCAVGAIIPDELYSPNMEGGSVFAIWGDLVRAGVVPDGHPEMRMAASALQEAHDSAATQGGTVQDFLRAISKLRLDFA